ncbi:FecR domain-containing protein [Pseudomonas sp. UBA4194]|uniref:FecR domain-containing protein n=1 Tax=Pseudomonas sp. UBA4194 TaxID=1947317 RepID=UPI0025F49560|nr:FecR domain-containing protein [Pseudomonas sp. UBA4194]
MSVSPDAFSSSRTSPDTLSHTSLQQAAQWYVLLADEQCAPQARDKWQRWHARCDENRAAWQYVQRVGQRFAPLREEGGHAAAALRETGARISRRQGLKTLLLLGAGSMAGWGGWRTVQDAGWTADLSTATGEIRETLLADGSHLWLAPRTAVDTYFDDRQRHLRLRFGEVLIETASDPRRAFTVQTQSGLLQALGTRFAVKQAGNATRLNVYQGAVQVRTAVSGEQRVISAGQRVDFDALRIGATGPAQTAGQSWVRAVLTAEGMPLGELIEELGRYRAGHLGVHPDVVGLTVMGTFPLDRSDQALDLLQAALPVRIRRLTSWWVTVEPA